MESFDTVTNTSCNNSWNVLITGKERGCCLSKAQIFSTGCNLFLRWGLWGYTAWVKGEKPSVFEKIGFVLIGMSS